MKSADLLDPRRSTFKIQLRNAECGSRNESGSNNAMAGPQRRMDVTKIPFGAGLGRRSVYDLERGRNGYGREIFVEQRCDTTGKPTIWYEFNGQGILTKHVRKGGGIDLTRLGKSPYL